MALAIYQNKRIGTGNEDKVQHKSILITKESYLKKYYLKKESVSWIDILLKQLYLIIH